MTDIQLKQMNEILKEIPELVGRFGKDAERIKAFVDDAQEAVEDAVLNNDPDTVTAVFGALNLVVLKGLHGIKKFKLFGDPFKDMRSKCDEVAKLLDFKRYKKMRNL